MRRSSLWAVMSPLMSMTRAWPDGARTSSGVAVSGMPAPFRAAHGAVLVVGYPHEVRQPRDLEDLAVVVGEPAGREVHGLRPRLREQAHDQRDAGAVDVVGAGEVEDDRVGAGGRLVVGGLQRG